MDLYETQKKKKKFLVSRANMTARYNFKDQIDHLLYLFSTQFQQTKLFLKQLLKILTSPKTKFSPFIYLNLNFIFYKIFQISLNFYF